MAMLLIDTKEIVEGGIVYIVETYRSDKTGKESTVKRLKPSDEPAPAPEPEPTQLDRIEALVERSHEDISNAAIDAFTLELMESGVL